ncbi:hypothetical protein Tco_1222987 [Tanacetum coccineum]
MLDNSFGDETLEELTVVVIMMTRIQPADDNAMTEPVYDAKAVSEVNASHKMIPKGVYKHKNHGKRKTIINISDDDQIDYNIIFDDPYVENNETEEDLSKSFSPAWLTIPSWTMSISLTEVETKCLTSRRFTRQEKDMLYVKKNKVDLLRKVASKVGIEYKPELRPTKDLEAKYNKVKVKLALLSSSASTLKTATVKNKGLIDEAYEWDEEEVSSDENEMVKVKVLMALTEENDAISKEGARNGEWVKISMRKVHTLLEMEDNDDRKPYLYYLCIDLNYVEEKRNNLSSKYIDLVHELNTCKEQLLVLKQVKLDFLTMQHVNTKILKENKKLRTELKELTTVTETWLNSSNKVNQCISEQIPSQKKRILGVDQLTEDPSSSGQKDLVFVKSSVDDTKVSTPGVKRPWLSEAEGFILPNHVTADESLICSTPLPPLKKLDGVEPVSRPKTIKSILRSKSTFKAKTLKGVIINESFSAPTKGNKSSPASKVNSAPAGKLKSMKIKDGPPLAIVIKELNNLKLQISKNQSSYSRCNQP